MIAAFISSVVGVSWLSYLLTATSEWGHTRLPYPPASWSHFVAATAGGLASGPITVILVREFAR